MIRFISHELSRQLADLSEVRSENEALREQIFLLRARVQELESLASEDPLVGLPNRRDFLSNLETVIARVAPYHEQAR